MMVVKKDDDKEKMVMQKDFDKIKINKLKQIKENVIC